jgi:aspartate-semialdehyde dehydrogenase
MTGDIEPSGVFPQSLAFDCLPQVGELLDGGDSSEEARLRHVLRRLLDRPALAVEITRLRVPTFGGSLIVAHAQFAQPLDPARARALWAQSDVLSVLDEDLLPTPRTCIGAETIAVGRVRADGDPTRLGFAIALDDLRRGSALSAVLAAESWIER